MCRLSFVLSLLLLVQDTQVGWQPIGEERVAVSAKDLVHTTTTTWSAGAARRTIKSCLFAVLKAQVARCVRGYERGGAQVRDVEERCLRVRRVCERACVSVCVCKRVCGCVRAARESGSHAGRLAWGGA